MVPLQEYVPQNGNERTNERDREKLPIEVSW